MNDVLTVLKEAFMARLLPIFHEVQLPAIQKFQPDAYPAYAVAAALGALMASVLLYLLGRWLRRMPERVSNDEQRARIEGMRGVAQHWLPYLLILSASPFGGILIISAGFFALRPLVAGLAILAAEVLWRVSPVL